MDGKGSGRRSREARVVHRIQPLKDVPDGKVFVVLGRKGFFLKERQNLYKVRVTKYHNQKIRVTVRLFQGEKLKEGQTKCVVLSLSALMPSHAEIMLHPKGKSDFHIRRVAEIPSLVGGHLNGHGSYYPPAPEDDE